MSTREDDIVAAFVSMACSLAQGHDVSELLDELAADCARLLDVSAVGLLLADQGGALHVVAASSERVADLEAFQAQRAQGPCHTCYLDGQPVNVPDLAAAATKWPEFAAVAAKAGVASVHAVPMRLRDATVGALNLFGATTGSLNEADLRLAQALADVATIALIQDRAAVDTSIVNEQLQHALDSRVILEQAKGVVAYSGDLDLPAAYAALRNYARNHNIRLTDLARPGQPGRPRHPRPRPRPGRRRSSPLRPSRSRTIPAQTVRHHSPSSPSASHVAVQPAPVGGSLREANNLAEPSKGRSRFPLHRPGSPESTVKERRHLALTPFWYVARRSWSVDRWGGRDATAVALSRDGAAQQGDASATATTAFWPSQIGRTSTDRPVCRRLQSQRASRNATISTSATGPVSRQAGRLSVTSSWSAAGAAATATATERSATDGATPASTGVRTPVGRCACCRGSRTKSCTCPAWKGPAASLSCRLARRASSRRRW